MQSNNDEPRMYDNISYPRHHVHGGIETIDFIEAKGLHEDYYLGNVVKYVARHKLKGGIHDLEKAAWYLDRKIALAKRQEQEHNRTREALDEQMNRLAEINRVSDR